MPVSVFRSILTVVAVLLVGSASAQVSSTDTQQVSVSFNVALISASDTAITDVTFDDSTWVASSGEGSAQIGDSSSTIQRASSISYTVAGNYNNAPNAVTVLLEGANLLNALRVELEVDHGDGSDPANLVLKDFNQDASTQIIEQVAGNPYAGLARLNSDLTYSFIVDVTEGPGFPSFDLVMTFIASAGAP